MLKTVLQVIPLATFWSLLYFGRGELRPRTAAIFIGLWLVSLAVVLLLGLPFVAFPAFESVLAVVLVLLVFGGDMRIR